MRKREVTQLHQDAVYARHEDNQLWFFFTADYSNASEMITDITEYFNTDINDIILNDVLNASGFVYGDDLQDVIINHFDTLEMMKGE